MPENYKHMLEIKFMLYNDIQVQTSLRISQTMEAGLTFPRKPILDIFRGGCYQHINSAEQVQEIEQHLWSRRKPVCLTHSFLSSLGKENYVT
jgi:hypothetical protein